MEEPTQYPYSLRFSLGTILVMVILLLLLLRNVIAANTTLLWTVYGFCVLIFISLASLLIAKRLVPAIKGDIALQVDEEGISDYISNITIPWHDIEEINLVRGRSASTIHIDLKWESDHGSLIIIPLRWVKGKDDDIYDTVLAYYDQANTDITD